MCLICSDLILILPGKVGIQNCECGELKIEQTKNLHRVFGTFGKYYCTNPQKKNIRGNQIKVITHTQRMDNCVAEVYRWETIDTFENMEDSPNRQVENRKLNKGNTTKE
jgi:hypothetical protein